MAQDESTIAIARNQAGRDAVEAVQVYGLDMGGEIIAGRARAYILAHVAVRGWDDTILLFDDLLSKALAAPHLTLIEGGLSA